MSEYINEAKTFLSETGTKMSIVFDSVVTDKEIGWGSNGRNMEHNKYIVTLARNNKSYSFPFYDSYQNYLNGERPTSYDILACLQKYDVEDLECFVSEFGYEVHSIADAKRVEKIWKSCKTQYQKLLRLFDNDYSIMEKLQEIN